MSAGDFIRQVGYVTPGHAAMWATDGVVQDSGPASGGFLTELGITNNTNTAFGINSAPVSAPYTALTFAVTTGVGATITLASYNGAGSGTLTFVINGTSVVFDQAGNRPIFTATTQGEVPASGGSTASFLRADGAWAIPGSSGGSAGVYGPNSSVVGDLASFANTSGNLIADTGVAASSVTIGAAASIDGDIAIFNGATGKSLRDTGVSTNGIVVMCACSGTNSFVLTPVTGSATPLSYQNYQSFRFIPSSTSSGAVTAAVGGLPRLPVYNYDAATQAGTNSSSVQDMQAGSVYTIVYNSLLNSGSGGFQIVDGPLQQILTAPHLLTTVNTSNSQNTLSSWSVNGNSSTDVNTRQFQTALFFNSSTGNGQTFNTGDRVTLYAGINGDANSGDIWSINSLLTISPLFPATGNAQGYELDLNNLKQHYGEATLSAGLAAPVSYGLSISGAGSFRSTSAMLVSGPGTSPIWNRGITFANNSVQQATIQDFTNSNVSYQVLGKHQVGIGMSAAVFTTAAMLLPNASNLAWVNAAGNAYISDTVDSNNVRILGAGGGGVGVATPLFPTVNGAVNLGLATSAWANVYCSALNLPVLGPVSWPKTGGGTVVDWTDSSNNRLVGANSAAVISGAQLIPLSTNAYSCGNSANLWSSIWSANGVIQTSDPGLKTDVAMLPPIRGLLKTINPRTFRWKVGGFEMQGSELTPVEGKRTHWGFLADEVKAAMDGIGMDFGGYVQSENGVQHLRPDQLVSALWKIVQEQDADIAAVKARLGIA